MRMRDVFETGQVPSRLGARKECALTRLRRKQEAERLDRMEDQGELDLGLKPRSKEGSWIHW